ncbi:hypothetical protein OIV83_004212 [Microbotryomycetes sp. JL201]|nr:hypothetical protein OIV83_004212 [Microbotryomycetes sp. JL201]
MPKWGKDQQQRFDTCTTLLDESLERLNFDADAQLVEITQCHDLLNQTKDFWKELGKNGDKTLGELATFIKKVHKHAKSPTESYKGWNSALFDGLLDGLKHSLPQMTPRTAKRYNDVARRFDVRY